MAYMEPSEEQISTVISITNLDPLGDRDLVMLALQHNGLNVEAVVGQYFDNPSNFTNQYDTWKEKDFHGDREGPDNNAGISFHIESANQNEVIQGVTPPPGLTAPSRPPSRTSNRSPMGRMADWVTGDAGLTSTAVPNSRSQEDIELENAIRLSTQEAEESGHVMPAQESGVANPTGAAQFGPANRTDYEPGEWAMVPTAVQQTPVQTAPSPIARTKKPDAPAFLIQGPSHSTHRLGGLLTILHEIPLARNGILETGDAVNSYGYSSEWWRGQEIRPPHVLAKIQSGEVPWNTSEGMPVFAEELHRLMAFLDQTNRCYGAVSSLTNTLPYPGNGVEKQLYECMNFPERTTSSGMGHSVNIGFVIRDDDGEEINDFGLLEIEVSRNNYQGVNTLYEAIDLIMWSDTFDYRAMLPDNRMAMLARMGEVFAIKFGGDGPGRALEVPMELYPERWLVSRKGEARRIQKGLVEVIVDMQRLATEAGELSWQAWGSPSSAERTVLIDKLTEQWGAYHEHLQTSGQYLAMAETGFDTTQYPDYRAVPALLDEEDRDITRKVEEVMEWSTKVGDSLQAKSQELNEHMRRLDQHRHFLGQLLTDPAKDRPEPMTCSKFNLRGVATAPDTVYVCRRTEPDLIDFGETLKSKDQWWRLAHNPNDQEPVQVEKVEFERVLRDMWQETNTPILVYATDVAIETEKAPLSKALEQFVRADNKGFRQEVHQFEQTEGSPTTPLSPSKRKYRADSVDSMDSNRASLGDAGPDILDRGFDSHVTYDGGSAIQMMDLGEVSQDIPPSDDVAEIHPSTLPDSSVEDMGWVPDKAEQPPPMDSVEMEERARPPPFLAARTASSEGGTRSRSYGMDMDMPERD